MVPPDLVILGPIATLRGTRGLGWVGGLAVTDGRVVAAADRHRVAALAGPRTRRLELASEEAAMPGLTDAHLHLVDAALAARQVDLAEAASLEAGLTSIRRAGESSDTDAWIEGRGWDAHRWGRWPTAADLERAAPGRRAALWAHDHHALWVSPAALTEAGISRSTPDPPGGLIRRDAIGTPTGVLHEQAARLVIERIPAPTVEAVAVAVRGLARRLLASGIVAVHDPGTLAPDPDLRIAVPAYARLADAGGLDLGIHVSIRAESLRTAMAGRLRSGDPIGDHRARIRVGWLKLFADGTLGSRTAAMLEPFEDEREADGRPGERDRGLFLVPPDELRALAERAARAGIATQVHAIGDAGVRAVLDALTGLPAGPAFWPRVEHAQLVASVDVPRFGTAGIAASVQPIQLRSDAAEAATAWGTRAGRDAYRWRSLAATGVPIPFGTDAPVEPWDPWPGLEIAITRRDPARPAAPLPGAVERLSVGRALRAACLDAARVAAETDRGRLTPGMRADLIVVPVAALRSAAEPGGPLGRVRPRLVIIGGRVVHES